MNNIRDVLIKLHYLDLEVHEIYAVVRVLSEFAFENNTLKKILKSRYTFYEQLNMERIFCELNQGNTKVITILDNDCPSCLADIHMPPLVLFYQGEKNCLSKRGLAVIGSRHHTAYGERVTKELVQNLVKAGFSIISGLAYGIDGIAHRECIEQGGVTIAVLGSGFLHIYPREHESLAKTIALKHLLISEYPPHAKPQKSHFPFRNRIVSGLSQGVVVVEAKKRSGTLITCDYALDQGKNIYAIPNDLYSESSLGCLELIKQGAKCITSVADILEDFKR